MKKILIVDDNIDHLSYLNKLLRKNHYEVNAMNEPKSALEEALQGDYALILLDVKMPELDGLEFYKIYKERSENQTPIWFITTHNASAFAQSFFSQGTKIFFPKDTPGRTILRLIDAYFKANSKKLKLAS